MQTPEFQLIGYCIAFLKRRQKVVSERSKQTEKLYLKTSYFIVTQSWS